MRHDDDVAAYIGLDWGDQQHLVQLAPGGGGPIEQRRGAVIHALMQYDFLVLYPINPKALARYREAFDPSGAKDDPTDAALLLDLVCHHRAKLRAWHPDTVTAQQLDLLCERCSVRRAHQPAHEPAQAILPAGARLGGKPRLPTGL